MSIDFSKFDGDHDGVLDAVIFHFAGQYTADQNSPWYSGTEYATSAPGGFGTIGGLKFTTYIQITAEFDNFQSNPYSGCYQLASVACHELMHTLGMYDLYSQAQFALLPTNDLMSSNDGTINPYTKILLGWVDNIKVITTDTDDIRLDLYRYPNQVVLITNQYNGLFEEFYVVACLEKRTSSVYDPDEITEPKTTIWYVDARLNGAGTGFLNDNLYYSATPDQDVGHGIAISPYLFIEELCGDPKYNYVIDGEEPVDRTEMGFKNGSVIGPNHLLSSDTHDGNFTGILIDDFQVPYQYWESGYVTFDVSYITDTVAPILKTDENSANFFKDTTLTFSEAVYPSKNWDDIQVLDSKGNPIE